VSAVFAFECFADQDVFFVLKDELKLPVKKEHSGTRGEVVNAVKKGLAQIGMIDEDPGKSHHRWLDQLQVIKTTQDLVLRGGTNRHLILIKPALEECFLQSAKRVQIRTDLPDRPSDLRDALGPGNQRKHEMFRKALTEMVRESRNHGVPTFITDLHDMVLGLLSAAP